MADWHGFYKLSWRERLDKTIENKQLTAEQVALIEAQYDAVGEQQVENYLLEFILINPGRYYLLVCL